MIITINLFVNLGLLFLILGQNTTLLNSTIMRISKNLFLKKSLHTWCNFFLNILDKRLLEIISNKKGRVYLDKSAETLINKRL